MPTFTGHQMFVNKLFFVCNIWSMYVFDIYLTHAPTWWQCRETMLIIGLGIQILWVDFGE